jgi:uncharacterized membrane protein
VIKELILTIYNYLASNIASKEIVTVILASLPIIEARYAIPLSFYLMKLDLIHVFYLSLLGNMIPVIPLLLLLKPVSRKLRKFKLWRIFFDRLTERTRKRARLIEKYEVAGLIIFVSIPLPITGAWTGTLAASLFKIKFRYAFLAIFTGVVLSSSFVLFLTLLGRGLLWLGQSRF